MKPNFLSLFATILRLEMTAHFFSFSFKNRLTKMGAKPFWLVGMLLFFITDIVFSQKSLVGFSSNLTFHNVKLDNDGTLYTEHTQQNKAVFSPSVFF